MCNWMLAPATHGRVRMRGVRPKKKEGENRFIINSEHQKKKEKMRNAISLSLCILRDSNIYREQPQSMKVGSFSLSLSLLLPLVAAASIRLYQHFLRYLHRTTTLANLTYK